MQDERWASASSPVPRGTETHPEHSGAARGQPGKASRRHRHRHGRSLPQLRTMEVNGPGRILGSVGGRNAGRRDMQGALFPLQHSAPAPLSSILLQHFAPASCYSISLQYPTLASCSARPVPSHCPGRRMETVCSLIPHMIHIHSQLIPCTFWVGKGFSHFSPLTNMGATFHPWGLSPTCSLDQFAKPKS